MIRRSKRDAHLPGREGPSRKETLSMPTTTARAARMPKKALEKYRKLLHEKKTALLAELAKTKHAEEETTEESTQDIADRAVSSYTREFLYSLNDTARNTMQQIDQALSRIEDGTYGLCLNCGSPMNEKRLTAIPWSRHCLECQELAEKGLLEA